LVALGVAVLLSAGQADDSKKPPAAPFPTPEDAVKAWLAAQQQRDQNAAAATYPQAVRQGLKELVPTGVAARQALERLEDALFDKFGGRKRGVVDPADIFPLLRAAADELTGKPLVRFEVKGKPDAEGDQVAVRVAVVFKDKGKELAAEESFRAVKEGKGWAFADPHVAEGVRLRVGDAGRRRELLDFARRAKEGFERVEKDVKAGKLKTFDEALQALKVIKPIPQ
jgi:hypothetical protein